MIAERKIAALRLMAAAFLVAGCALGGALLTAAPASAQETTPWYMPQAWMYPQMTAPTGQRRPGSYGHSRRYHKAYGSFSNYCYGDCGYRRGTIATGGGVILYRPVVVLLDPRDFEVVPRGYYGAQQPVSQYASAPPEPATYVARKPTFTALSVSTAKPRPALAGGKPLLISVSKARTTFVRQNGVRIIRPSM